MFKRVLSVAFVAAALPAAAADAATTVYLLADESGPDLVMALNDEDETPAAIDVTRAGTTIAASAEGFAEVPELQTGDTVTTYANGAVTSTTVYDGLPTITAPVCVGHSSFTGKRGAGATIMMAGSAAAFESAPASWTAGEAFTVTLPSPIVHEDGAYVVTTRKAGDATIHAMRLTMAVMCPDSPPPPAQTPEPPIDDLPVTPDPTVPVSLDLTVARASLEKAGLRKLARRKTRALAFAFPEPGTVTLRLTAKGRLIGSGTRALTRSGDARVTLRLTRSGRRLLARSRKLRVTLRATFAAAGGSPAPRVDETFTLRR